MASQAQLSNYKSISRIHLYFANVRPGLVKAHEPEDVSPREVLGDKEGSVVDKTDKHRGS